MECETNWCVLMILFRLIAPLSTCFLSTGRTSGGFAGSMIVASFVLSSMTR